MEKEIRRAEKEHGDAANIKGESSAEMSNSSATKRGRGRPQGSKKLKVCVTDVNLMELVSGISNGGSTQPQRGRGRPKLCVKGTEQQGSGDDDADTPQNQERSKVSKREASDKDSPLTEHSPKKRGRPKKSPSKNTTEKTDDEELPNGGSDTPKAGRGRPKGSTKRKLESLTSSQETVDISITPRKRGRPKDSLNNTLRLEREESSEREANADTNADANADANANTDANGSITSLKRGRGRPRKVNVNNIGESTQDTTNGILEAPKRGRGRPRKSITQESGDKQADGSQLVKRRRGWPEGSLNKKPYTLKVALRMQVSPAKGKRGRPKKQPAKRGRPRKYPLPSPEELKKPKVWKPLGRPRKYPRVDPPEGVLPAPRRSRGRPPKSASKKGAHLHKNFSTAPSSTRNPNGGSLKKRGSPPSTAKSEVEIPHKRGRPKGSLNKNKTPSETRLDSALTNHSKSDSTAVGSQNEGGSVQADLMPIELESETEETLNKDASSEVSNQA